MAAIESVTLSVFSTSSSSNFFLSPKPLASVKLNISYSTPTLSLNFPFSPLRLSNPPRRLCFVLPSAAAVQEADTGEEREEVESISTNNVAVFNLPFSVTSQDLETLFSRCGTVTDAQIVTSRRGKSRGFAFVTMSTAEEAQETITKFDYHNLSGRVIRVELAKKSTANETRHEVYVSNIAWKVRSANLKEFFSAGFNPVSARVVFDIATKRAAGYGFVAFATKEEAEAAIAALDGKPLMDRPLALRLSDPSLGKSKMEDEDLTDSDESEFSE